MRLTSVMLVPPAVVPSAALSSLGAARAGGGGGASCEDDDNTCVVLGMRTTVSFGSNRRCLYQTSFGGPACSTHHCVSHLWLGLGYNRPGQS